MITSIMPLFDEFMFPQNLFHAKKLRENFGPRQFFNCFYTEGDDDEPAGMKKFTIDEIISIYESLEIKEKLNGENCCSSKRNNSI